MLQLKRAEIYRKTHSLSAGQTIVDIPSDKMPKGLIHKFVLHLRSAACTGMTAAATDYYKVVRSMTYGSETPKHNVMSGVPNMFWDPIWTAMQRKASHRVAPTAGSGFELDVHLPFSYPGTDKDKAYRPKDTGLLNIKNRALPFATFILGSYLDLGTTITACDVVVSLEVYYEPVVAPGLDNPINPLAGGDQPGRMFEVLVKQKADLSTSTEENLTTGGGRACIAAFMRELTSAGAISADIFTVDTVTPSKVDFVLGESDNYTPGMKVEGLDRIIEDELGVALPAGHHGIIFAADGSLLKAVPLQDGPSWKFGTNYLGTTAARVLEIMLLNTLDLSSDVRKEHADWLAGK